MHGHINGGPHMMNAHIRGGTYMMDGGHQRWVLHDGLSTSSGPHMIDGPPKKVGPTYWMVHIKGRTHVMDGGY